MKTAPVRIGLRILALLLPVSFTLGQEVNLRKPSRDPVVASPRTVPETYGTLSPVVDTVWASQFQFFADPSNTEGLQDDNTGARRCGTGSCGFLGSFHLPNGAALVSIELEACDGSAVNELQFFLARLPTPAQPGQLLSAQTSTGTAATPGCALVTTPAFSYTVDNAAESYAVAVLFPSDPDISLSAARIRYNLQVSPAPGTATFNDVPTGHPQFQFIEALVAAGVTAGCGGGNYCPNATLTRGQMAVFLAKALGLHFPN